MKSQEYFTMAEVAKQKGVDVSTVHRWRTGGRLTCVWGERGPWVTTSEFLRLMEPPKKAGRKVTK